jgi:hypothetical protein
VPTISVTATGRGAFAVGETHTDAVAQVCDTLGLSKRRIIGGRYSRDAPRS